MLCPLVIHRNINFLDKSSTTLTETINKDEEINDDLHVIFSLCYLYSQVPNFRLILSEIRR